MDQQTCRIQLERLIREETAALGELGAILDREFALMSDNNVDALIETSRERHQCVARILKVDESRRALCRTKGHTLDLKGLEALIAWCDPQRTLVPVWQACTVAATQCRGLNDRNSALASARLQNVQTRLGILIEGRRETVTYGPRGTYTAPSARQGLLREA